MAQNLKVSVENMCKDVGRIKSLWGNVLYIVFGHLASIYISFSVSLPYTAGLRIKFAFFTFLSS